MTSSSVASTRSDPHRNGDRARRTGRPQAPDHRALADRLHGLHRSGGARARGRARRHVQRRHGRADPARSSGIPTAACTAGPSTRSSSRPRTRSRRRSPTSRRGAKRRSCVSPSMTASSCTGSTTKASHRGACPPRAAAGGRPVQGTARSRQRARDRREGRRRPVCPPRLTKPRRQPSRVQARDRLDRDHRVDAGRGREVATSATTRLRTSQVWPAGSAAEVSGEAPIRAEPMRWNE